MKFHKFGMCQKSFSTVIMHDTSATKKKGYFSHVKVFLLTSNGATSRADKWQNKEDGRSIKAVGRQLYQFEEVDAGT